MEKNENLKNYPVIALSGCVLYPENQLYLETDNQIQIKILEETLENKMHIFLVAKKVTNDDLNNNNELTLEVLYDIGVLAQVKQVVKKNGSYARILLEGGNIVSLVSLQKTDEKIYIAKVKDYVDKVKLNIKDKEDEDLQESLIRTVKNLFKLYISYIPKVSREVIKVIFNIRSPKILVDYIASNIPFEISIKQELLKLTLPVDRLYTLANVLKKEINIISYELEINEKLKDNIDKNQRDYYLKEQIKVLNNELGEEISPQKEADNYVRRIEKLLEKSQKSREHLIKEANKIAKMPYLSHESAVIKTHLDICLNLPWKQITKDRINVKKAKDILDKNHYGLEKIKERILEMVAVKALDKKTKWQILCFVGPPGVGKTSISKAIAEAINRKYVQISLGGVKDESEIRGHRKTYVGAMPGRIISALSIAKTKNPLILLDEIDKMTNDYRSDPTSAFLEILDYEQNSNFVDNYIEIPFDLSDVLFITTANYLEDIPRPLIDRMEIIELSSYTRIEKFNIIKKHIIPKQIKEHGVNNKRIKFSDEVIYKVIDEYTREAGVRAAQRSIAKFCRRAAKKLSEDSTFKIQFDVQNMEKFVGKPKYNNLDILKKDEIGVVTGLAWTQVGGETMCIEALSMEGTGKLELTGSLGNVMQESAKAAVSYIRKVSGTLNMDKEFYKNSDIHLHVPEGAVPKDGPSAGTAISTAIVSELIKKPIRKDVAITGEITLRGKVLPVGGIREKVIAAHKVGVKTVVLPKDNKTDLDEVEDGVKNDMQFVFADDVNTVWKTALVDF